MAMVYRSLWFPKTVCRARVPPFYFSPGFIRDWSLELLHRLEAYATLLSGVSSDLSKCFLRGVLRAHRYHAAVLV